MDTWRVVHATNTRPDLFQRSRSLVRLTSTDGSLRIDAMDEDAVYGYLARIANWMKVMQYAEIDTSPSRDVARDMLVYPAPELPTLEAAITTPVFDREGRLVLTPGYHAGARLWYEPPPGLSVPPVPERPSPEEVAAARSLFLDDLLGDFPFVDASTRAHMIAALLLPFARRLIQGPTPIHLIEAPTEGSGKGLLVNLIALLATGAPAVGGSIPEDEDEVRKRLGTELSTGRPLLILDNADTKRRLDSSALASATTMWPAWTDRLLGHNKMFTAPNEAVWIVTANNPRLSRELARRCVSIRIDPRVDRPWLRLSARNRSSSSTGR